MSTIDTFTQAKEKREEEKKVSSPWSSTNQPSILVIE